MQRYIFIGAHPDDIETMLGYHAHAHAADSIAIVATDGTQTTVNRTNDDSFVTAGKRRQESQRGLKALGFNSSQQVFLDLADGNLKNHITLLADMFTELARAQHATTFVTLGADGFDGHPDHSATHQAAVRAQATLLAKFGTKVAIEALNSKHAGKIVVDANHNLNVKLSAMACHASQFELYKKDQTVGLTAPSTSVLPGNFTAGTMWWNEFVAYHPLILQGETYDILNPKTPPPSQPAPSPTVVY